MKRLDCLDGLRGVLALYVTLGHMAPFAPLPGWVQSTLSHGGAAVDVFFMLSGLVISQSLQRLHGDKRRFLLARVMRLYPVYLPVLAVAIAIEPVSCGFDLMPWIGPGDPARDICTSRWPQDWAVEIAAHLTMTHGLVPDGALPDVWLSFLGAAWSLSTEWQFYVLAALIWRPGERRLLIGLLLFAAAGQAWLVLAPADWQFSRAFLPNRAHFFALGVASQALIRGEPMATWRYAAVLAATLAICGLHLNLQIGKLLPPIVWTTCLAAQLQPRFGGLILLHRLLRCRTALWFGAVSYPLYLVNEPIQKLLLALLAGVAAGNARLFTAFWLPASIAVPVLIAAALHRTIERPAMQWGKSRAPGVAAAVPVPALIVPLQADARGVAVQGGKPGL
ncbi:MAG: acyltransferase [Proteobacteria bacterium]|nr:acyltransferase [Pseudomonadota bacterium]